MRGGDAQGGISAVFMYEKHPATLLDKAGLHGYNIKRGTLLQQSDPYRIKIYLMTVWGLAKRSSRFYTEDVQQDYCTYEKLKCLFPHSRHLLPAADSGKGTEGLTAM